MDYKVNDNYNSHIIEESNPQFSEDYIKKYFFYVLERHNIQMLKESGSKFPWTDNKILQDNSFTCNRRIDDRTTKWLLNHITNNSTLSLNDKVWRSIIFRLYNKIETAELIELDSANFWDNIERYADILDSQTNDVYTRAYKTVSIKYRSKYLYPDRNWRSLTLLSIERLKNNYISIPEQLLSTPLEALGFIKQIPGVGDFIGMQILIDLMYIDEIPYSNNCFVVAGPGARVGLDRIFLDKDGLTYEDCLFYITINFEKLCQKYYDSSFNYNKIKEDLDDNNAYCVTDIQNTFCEFSKFCYLLENKHKNKRKYVPYNGGNK